MAKIIVVTKDIAEFNIYSPVVATLRDKRHRVCVIAEGLSLGKWVEAGEDVWFGQPDPDQVDVNGCRHDITDCELALETFKPNLMLTGLGAPINLGETFGLAANQLGIKLGYFIDVWGAESRSKAVPDFICTLDQFGEQKIQAYAPYQGRMPKVYVTGSPAMDRLAKVEEPWGILGLSLFWDDPVVLFVGQDESTTPALEGLVQALNNWGKPYVLVPRFHPKFQNRTDLLAKWNAILAEAAGDVIQVSPEITTQQIMTVANYTVSIYSNALIEAAALGSLPVSWVSDIGRASMRQALGGLERFPLVDYGCAVEVETPEQFQEILLDGPTIYRDRIRRCQTAFPCDGKNTDRVVSALEAELL